MALAGTSSLPANAAAKNGQLCKKVDLGKSEGSLTCVQDGKATRWRAAGGAAPDTTKAPKTTKPSTTVRSTATTASKTTPKTTKAQKTTASGDTDAGGTGKGGRKICADFSTQTEAKAWIKKHPEDAGRLDKNNDGTPCESLKP